MAVKEEVLNLFYGMVSYSNSIYQSLYELCQLEHQSKKDEKSYHNTLKNLKDLLDKETDLYKNNIDIITDNRGELFYLVANNGNTDDISMFDLLSCFDKSSVYERVKSKLKYHIGLNRTFNKDLLSGLKINYFDERTNSAMFFDNSFIMDMQRLSIFYAEKDSLFDDRYIDYKYLSAMLFNIDKDLALCYFETANTNIYLNSTLTYGLNGRYSEIYLMDLTDVLLNKFNEFVDYICYIDDIDDEDKDYKMQMALNYLKSILDLMPISIKEEFYNDFVMGISDDYSIPNRLKLLIVNNLKQADKGRRLINYISVGKYQDWGN